MTRLMTSTVAPVAASSGEPTLERLWNNAILLACVIVGVVVVLWIARHAVRRARSRVEGATGDEVRQARRNAAITFAVVNVVRVGVFIVLAFVVLAALGANIGPLLAGASFIGAGLAFGAQSIVRDYLAGFYILTEDQFSVGDSIEIALTGAPAVSGSVVDLTLRRTAVRVRDGSIVSFGNGATVSTRNRSRGTGVLRVEVEVPRRGTLEEMHQELDDLVDTMQRDADVTGLATSDLFALGAEPMASGSVQLVVTAETLPSHRTDLEREIRTRLNRRFLSEPADPTDAADPADSADPA